MIFPPLQFVSVLALVAALTAGAQADEDDEEEEIRAEVWSYSGKDIYPSALISTATVDWQAHREAESESSEEVSSSEEDSGEAETEEEEEEASEEEEPEAPVLGDSNGWFGARFYHLKEGTKVRVEVSSPGWLKPSRTEVTAAEDLEQVVVIPKAIFDFDALSLIRQQKPAVLTVKMWLDGKKLPDQTENVILRSINECPFIIHFGEGETPDDLSWMFAAYVNENHPWIDGILKEALALDLVDSFDGYQSGDKDKVMQQVYAVWHVLQRHGIRYSDITATPRSKSATAQIVRFLDDSVKGSQANCVDGSVIMASILTKISIHCGLVLVPGHCFVCFDVDGDGTLDPTSDTCFGVETTLLGADKLEDAATLRSLPAAEALKARKAGHEASLKTFVHAVGTAASVFKDHGEEFLDDEAGTSYQIIPISEARELGIMPLAGPASSAPLTSGG